MRITKVYTRTGDDGTTGLAGGQRVPKDAPRIESYGTFDELNSAIGLALALGVDDSLCPELRRIQNDLFIIGAELCSSGKEKKEGSLPQIGERHVVRLEGAIDELLKGLLPLKEFILPGGTPGAAALHVARTVCRRAERLLVALSRAEPVGRHVIQYTNRLSDLLFVMARHENRVRGHEEPYWDRAE